MTQGPTALTGTTRATRAGAATGTRRKRPTADSGRQMAGKVKERTARQTPANDALLYFPRGLYGFPGPLHFRVFDVPESGYMFRVLKSGGADKLAFALVDASLFLNYAPVASAEDLADVGLTTGEEAIWMVIANIPSTLEEATVNLKAPLLINPFTRAAKQVILEANYDLRQPLVSR